MDASIFQTRSLVPMLSVLEGFHCVSHLSTVAHMYLLLQVRNAHASGAVAVVMMRPENESSLGPPTSRIYSELACCACS